MAKNPNKIRLSDEQVKALSFAVDHTLNTIKFAESKGIRSVEGLELLGILRTLQASAGEVEKIVVTLKPISYPDWGFSADRGGF